MYKNLKTNNLSTIMYYCILLDFKKTSPCGTNSIHVLQWNNRIVVRECTTLLLMRMKNGCRKVHLPMCLFRRCGCARVLRTF